MKVTVYNNDQKIYASGPDAEDYATWKEGALLVVNGEELPVFFYVPRPGQYGKVQILDKEEIVRINE